MRAFQHLPGESSGRGSALRFGGIEDALQETMRDDLAIGIEALTGRRVIAQTGTATLEPDVTSDLFILDEHGSPANDVAGAGHPVSIGRNRRPVV